MSQHRVAVIGSGPSGMYCVDTLIRSDADITVDVFDRLPTPFGLVRYGVAPDHAHIKAVTRVLARPFESGRVRFVGNTHVGHDIVHDDLMSHYDAVVYATGAEIDRRLSVPGEDLEGVLGAGQFVRWYNGHPDAAPVDMVLDSTEVVVVGGGNVALDVVRVLARTPEELESTDVPERVLETLRASRVRDIHLIVRGRSVDAKFTPVELAQLSELADADVTVHTGTFGLPEPADVDDRRVKQNLEELHGMLAAGASTRSRHIHLHFETRPVRVLGSQRARGLEVEATDPTGRLGCLDAQMIFTAVGFRAAPIDGLPFDSDRGVVPNDGGRVLGPEGAVPGLYVAGWLKRGPNGVIGTNKPDAAETARAVLADLASAPVVDRSGPTDAIGAVLCGRTDVVNWEGWLRLELYEGSAGLAVGRGRVKVHDVETMLHRAAPLAGTGAASSPTV